MQELKFLCLNLAIRSLFNLMVLLDKTYLRNLLGKTFLMLRLPIIFSTSLRLVFLKWGESNVLVMIFTMLEYVEEFNYRQHRIKISTFHWKRLRFWYVQSRYYIREKLIKCLTELLVTGYGFTIISEVIFFNFWWILS